MWKLMSNTHHHQTISDVILKQLPAATALSCLGRSVKPTKSGWKKGPTRTMSLSCRNCFRVGEAERENHGIQMRQRWLDENRTGNTVAPTAFF